MGDKASSIGSLTSKGWKGGEATAGTGCLLGTEGLFTRRPILDPDGGDLHLSPLLSPC